MSPFCCSSPPFFIFIIKVVNSISSIFYAFVKISLTYLSHVMYLLNLLGIVTAPYSTFSYRYTIYFLCRTTFQNINSLVSCYRVAKFLNLARAFLSLPERYEKLAGIIFPVCFLKLLVAPLRVAYGVFEDILIHIFSTNSSFLSKKPGKKFQQYIRVGNAVSFFRCI